MKSKVSWYNEPVSPLTNSCDGSAKPIIKFGLHAALHSQWQMIKLFFANIIILLESILSFQKIRFCKFHYIYHFDLLIVFFILVSESLIHSISSQQDTNRPKKKTLKGCKKSNRIQTDKTIWKGARQTTRNDSTMMFDLWRIIIWNGSGIVTLTITKIPSYINQFQWNIVTGIKAIGKSKFNISFTVQSNIHTCWWTQDRNHSTQHKFWILNRLLWLL